MDELPAELVISLRTPLALGDLSFNEIKLREPTAAQWAEWDKLAGVEADIKAVALVAGLPEAIVRQVPAREFIKATRYISAFLA